MINFLQEIKSILKENDKDLSDISWVGLNGKQIEINLFLSKCDFLYDNGFGSNKIPMNLLIVGKNFWLERHEYDGSEWFEFKSMPKRPSGMLEIRECNIIQC